MGLDNLWKPDLRGRIEAGINRIAAGQVGKEVILGQAVAAFEADFATAMQRTQVGVLSGEGRGVCVVGASRCWYRRLWASGAAAAQFGGAC
jgi:hypothetical protein